MSNAVANALRSARWQLPWVLALLSVAALPGAWYWWSLERLSARGLQQALQREAVVAPLESQVTAHMSSWKAAQAGVAAAQEKIKISGEAPQQWSHRSLTIDNQRMSRVEVERYLRELRTDQRNLLVPTSLNVRAAKTGESIFAVHQGQDSADALVVTIKAELYTRSAP